MSAGPILMVSEHWAPEGSGAEWSNLAWARGLVQRGEIVVVLTPGSDGRDWSTGEPAIYRKAWPSWPSGWLRTRTPWWHLVTLWRTLRAVGIVRPRVIHVVGKGMLVGAWLAGKLTRTPAVFTLRDLNMLCPTGYRILGGGCDCKPDMRAACDAGYLDAYHPGAGWWRRLRLQAGLWVAWANLGLQQMALRGCAVVTAVSRDLLDRHPAALTGRALRRVTYTAPPDPGERPSLLSAALMADRLKLAGVPLVLYVGKLSHGKGTDDLLSAMRKVRARVPEATLVMVGTDRTVGNPGVICVGRLPQADVFALYRLADVVVVPSVWPEPYSRVLLEAMTFGCAVVATDVGGNRELAEGCAFLTPPSNVEALADTVAFTLRLTPEGRANVGVLATQRVASRFNTDRSLTALLDAYAEATR